MKSIAIAAACVLAIDGTVLAFLLCELVEQLFYAPPLSSLTHTILLMFHLNTGIPVTPLVPHDSRLVV